jgi:hypothetical protein
MRYRFVETVYGLGLITALRAARQRSADILVCCFAGIPACVPPDSTKSSFFCDGPKTVENGWDFARLAFPALKRGVNKSGGEKAGHAPIRFLQSNAISG